MITENELKQIKEKINEIEEKSGDGGYIYRGERQCNEKVSSNLYRDFDVGDTEDFDIEVVQKEMLNGAKKHTGHLPLTGELLKDDRQSMAKMFSVREEDTPEAVDDFEILTEIQHYGGKTNLIDFTTDYLVALFFACDGHHDKDGRVILQKVEEIQGMIKSHRNPRHRVASQKSVFVRPPNGYIEPNEDNIVIIPASLKKLILQHLRKYHGIFTESIYNDVYGFIRSQDIHGDAYTQFYRGVTCHNRADVATTAEVKQKEYENAIQYYSESIKYKPDNTAAYYNRGIAYYKIGDYNRAIEDYDKAIEIQPDYAKVYCNRGVAYNRKGDYNRAIEDYDKAIEIQPDDAESYSNRGVAYDDIGDYNRAIEDYDKAIEIQPDYVQAYINRGVTYYKKGDYNRATEDFNKAIEIQPDYAKAYSNRGEVWLHLKDWEKAKADLITAKDMGDDIVASFRNDYESVADFEQKTGIQLPEDIAAMLTPP